MGLLQGQSPCREQQSPRSWAALVEAVTQFLNQSAIIEQPGDPAKSPNPPAPSESTGKGGRKQNPPYRFLVETK